MSQAVLEAVPNVSEGRDPSVIAALADAVANVPGVDLVDVSGDPDHHRSVLTYLGPPDAVLEASVAVAREAKARIDLRRHEGVHPRIGALDVLALVPLLGLDLKEAATLARDLGRRIAEEVGIPVFLYAAASDPPGRLLADLRRGGLEAFGGGFPSDRLPGRGRVQVSMNLERPAEVSAAEIYQQIDRLARERGTRAAESEVVGLIPDEAAMSGASAFFRWSQASPSRLLSRRAAEHLAARAGFAALAERDAPSCRAYLSAVGPERERARRETADLRLRLARVNAAGGGAALSELEREAAEIERWADAGFGPES
ncbi:MAG: hypothetical protein HY702_04565 [Gemmatimonadetes bacterium]|nr:hypothetical protein [Gemmatimonadota bacterium]